ncbi:MAG TPA: Gfo/Idh/MocA family oxidoreductase [Bacteroidales bacterium]|nr:Gfo/Idh/MocA family oxidoreductase [Bacteroidales bacterium]HRZ20920.1 Gfo/Idh/MocA family oxidoreductase [Bacteroidales bacterium]
MIINTAIIGYGLSGRVFHAPFIHTHPGFRLHTIVTSGNEAAERYPGTRILRDVDAVIHDGEIDLVCICSPNEFHFDQARQALRSGKHVILEKPVTPSSREASDLLDLARQTQCHLFPFQNRRWDGDFLTLRQILDQELLGNVLEFESHFDRYNPEISRASWRYVNTTAGGTLYDLGTHLIDQALVLFGKPERIFCRLFNQRKYSVVDDSFHLNLLYPNLNVTLKAGVFVREKGPRFTVHGTRGSFVKFGLDPQEDALRNGKWPKGEAWGSESRKNRGILNTEANGHIIRGPVETFHGNYMGFFDNVYQVLTAHAEQAVKPEEAILALTVIEKARESHASGQVVSMEHGLRG